MKATRSVLCSALLLATVPATAKEVHLIAAPLTKVMPDSVEVVQWGFAEDGNTNGVLDAGEIVTSPGPMISVPYNDPGLTIYLHNTLQEPVSLIIPGEAGAGNPVFITDAQGRRRARSFTHETGPGQTGIYSWPTLSAGSQVYHSATYPQKQVPMGLYGGVTKDAAPGEAYTGISYSVAASIFFSEIDPVLNAAVANGEYGTAAYPSAIDYSPKYFLVNGEPYRPGVTPPMMLGNIGEPSLLRLFNMGLKTHMPVLQGAYVQVVAEDGFLYPFAREQYSISLPAAKTKDAIFTPQQAGTYSLFDRQMDLTDAGQPGGGMRVELQAGVPAGAPTAVDDQYMMDEDSQLVVAAPGVLSNDVPAGVTAIPGDPVTAGTLVLGSDGSFTYQPPPNFNGNAVFTYRTDNGSLQSAPATVVLTVSPVNDIPLATADNYSVSGGVSLTVAAPGVLSNDSDPDGDSLTATLMTGPANGTLELGADGGFTYTPNTSYEGPDSFSYIATDGIANSGETTVNLNVLSNANIPPVASDDHSSTLFKEPVTINVLSNDTDPDGEIYQAVVTVTTPPLQGAAVVNADGTVTYTPNPGFRGTDALGYTVTDTQGAVSNEATVRIDVIK